MQNQKSHALVRQKPTNAPAERSINNDVANESPTSTKNLIANSQAQPHRNHFCAELRLLTPYFIRKYSIESLLRYLFIGFFFTRDQNKTCAIFLLFIQVLRR